MKIGDKLVHPERGQVTVTNRKHNPMGNKIEWVATDKSGEEKPLDGTEKNLTEVKTNVFQAEKKRNTKKKKEKEETLEKEEQEIKELAAKKRKERIFKKKIKEVIGSIEGVSDSIRNKEVLRELSIINSEDFDFSKDVVDAIEKWQIDTIKAIRAIPEPKEGKDYTSQFKSLTSEIKGSKVDISGVLSLLSKISSKEIDLSGLSEISEKLDKLDKLAEKIEDTKFEIPRKFIHKDGIKVSVDRVATGVGTSGDTSGTSEDPLIKYKFSDTDDDASPNYYGATDVDGAYYILKQDTSAGTLRYTTGASAYATAWSNRASESYDYLFNVTLY